MSYPIETIAQWINAELIGPCVGEVKWLLTDSRSLGFPEETLFFALVTERGDGHRYIADLYRRGVRHFVVSQCFDEETLQAMPEANMLLVENTLYALQLLAESHRAQYKIPVVGIGGITTGKDAIEFLLAGATAIEVGTANFMNPAVTGEIVDYIEDYLVRHKMSSVQELIGALEV